MQILFHCQRNFSEVRIHELYAKFENGFDSSGASALNPQSMTVGGASTSMPVVAAGGPLAEPPSVPRVATRSPGLIPRLFGEGELDHVENEMREDDPENESDHILGDTEEDTPRTPPACRGPSSSGSGQQLPHFSTLNLEAIGQHPDIDPTSRSQGLHKENPSGDFQIGQSFQTKEEVVLSVKDYSIRRGVQYRVMESNHLKFHGRCKEFGNGCTWLIRITLRQRKVITIKVLQEATEATYGFRPSYRKVWMEKQKAVAQIYGD
ncbi:uncharacterized protein LOC107472813 [Arachis duranensis]|uniref:Uncharacterized protein LOC107472813 n=1 Tax=Arachis duranensis TaxID=130453 RepID=A0A6P4CAS7_ARADU|nr:uncharacterized protein LOC107472813 [Arachis duranensis]